MDNQRFLALNEKRLLHEIANIDCYFPVELRAGTL